SRPGSITASVFGGRLDVRRGRRTGIGPAAALEPADGADRHVAIDEDLAREADARQAAALEDLGLGLRHPLGLTRDELHAARRAARVAAAGVQLIDARVLLEREDEALSVGHAERAHSFDSQLGHGAELYVEPFAARLSGAARSSRPLNRSPTGATARGRSRRRACD